MVKGVCTFPSVFLVTCRAVAVLFWLSVWTGGRDVTRKQEAGWDHKNRKQEEAMIRWLLWCTLGSLLLWVIVCSPLNYRVRSVWSKLMRILLRQPTWGEISLCEAVRIFLHFRVFFFLFSNSAFIYVKSRLACSLSSCVFWCLSDRIHESLFVSGFQLGQWQAGLGLAGTLYLLIPNALISLLVATSLLVLGHRWSSLLLFRAVGSPMISPFECTLQHVRLRWYEVFMVQ